MLARIDLLLPLQSPDGTDTAMAANVKRTLERGPVIFDEARLTTALIRTALSIQTTDGCWPAESVGDHQ